MSEGRAAGRTRLTRRQFINAGSVFAGAAAAARLTGRPAYGAPQEIVFMLLRPVAA